MLYIVTGRIGSGKTTVTNYLQEKGYPVIRTDELLHLLYKDNVLKGTLISLFGENIYDVNGNPTPYLTQKITSNSMLLKMVEDITGEKLQQLVIDVFKNLQTKYDTIFLETAYPQKINVLFENLKTMTDIKILLVDKDNQKRCDCVKTRWIEKNKNKINMFNIDQLAEDYVKNFEQIQQDFNPGNVDITINNDGSISDLYNQLKEYFKL